MLVAIRVLDEWSWLTGGPLDARNQVSAAKLSVDRTNVMAEPREKVAASIHLAKPTNWVVITHGLLIHVEWMLAHRVVALLVKPQENLDSWEASHRPIEAQPVGGVFEFLGLSRDNRVALGFRIDGKACLHILRIRIEIAPGNFDQFRPSSVLHDPRVHDHDATARAEPFNDGLALFYGETLTQIGGIVKE